MDHEEHPEKHKNKPIGYILRDNQLPETDEPTPDYPLDFYKNKHRVGQFYNSEIGLLVLQYSILQ